MHLDIKPDNIMIKLSIYEKKAKLDEIQLYNFGKAQYFNE